MKKVIIVPDSFKSTLSAREVCGILSSCVRRAFPKCEVISIPLADGGEGTVDALISALGGEIFRCPCKGPFMEDMTGSFGIIGDTAFIEIASPCGLPMVAGKEDPLKTSTYGFGQLILAAAQKSVSKITLCLGGSCTNDFACGAASAVGVRFFDANGSAFVPTGGTLCNIDVIDLSGMDPILKNIKFTAMCDVTNPVTGPLGAAYIFAPQKGASQSDVILLDNGLRHICHIISRDFGKDYSMLPGGGAAGAVGAGAVFFLDCTLVSGADAVLDAANFDKALCGADLVITGEGKLDMQSFGGKAIDVISSRTSKHGIPLIVFAGAVDADADTLSRHGISAAFSINPLPLPFEETAKHAKENLKFTADNVFKLLSLK